MKERWPRYLYTLLCYVLLPFILLRLLWRGRKARGYLTRWGERFGRLPQVIPPGGKVIWIHAVSVGETLAALPLIHALQQRQGDAKILVTTTTPTGSERVIAALGDSVYHSYLPYDLPGALRRFLTAVQPAVLIVMETELWPNLIHACYRCHIPVLLANGRLSERSAKGYRRVAALTSPMLAKLAAIAVQTLAEKKRFIALGALPESITVTGNIKFDVQLPQDLRRQAAELRHALSGEKQRPVLLAASTHRGEDELILDVCNNLWRTFPNLLLVIAPRHPERFDEVDKLARQRGLTAARRSRGEFPRPSQNLMLCDTMGELLLFYGACDIAVIGGSLVPVGGHNMLEAAAWGVPIVTGPHLFNFSEASLLLSRAGAMAVCMNSKDLTEEMQSLLSSAELRHQKGTAARAIIESNQGALQKLLAVVESFI